MGCAVGQLLSIDAVGDQLGRARAEGDAHHGMACRQKGIVHLRNRSDDGEPVGGAGSQSVPGRLMSRVLDTGKISARGLGEHVQSSLHHPIVDAREFQRAGESHLLAHGVDHDAGFAQDRGHLRWRIHLDHEVIALGGLHGDPDVEIASQFAAPDAGGHEQDVAFDAFAIDQFDRLEAAAVTMHVGNGRIGPQRAAFGFESSS